MNKQKGEILPNFITDKEKMRDFNELDKEEFLKVYSYLTEEEYYNTKLLYWREEVKDLSEIQKEYMIKKCPHCEEGDLHPVPNQESEELYLWCDTCDLSMDSSGGYIN